MEKRIQPSQSYEVQSVQLAIAGSAFAAAP